MKHFTLWKQYLQHYNLIACNRNCNRQNSGFTLLELLIGLIAGSIILTSALGGFNSLRQLFVQDKVKTNINQRLTSAFGGIGPDIQQAGEGLSNDSDFPTIEVTDDANGSTITVRKADLIGFLPLCAPVNNGSTTNPNIIDEGTCDGSYSIGHSFVQH